MTTKNETKSKGIDHLWPLLIFIAAVLIIAASFMSFIYFQYNTWEIRGTFGDSFGGINALFSGLAFAGIIYTVLLQRRELELQREELSLTRKELKRTADAQEKSVKALTKQIDSMNDTARLNALQTLIEYYHEETGRNRHRPKISAKHLLKREETVAEIEEILRRIK